MTDSEPGGFGDVHIARMKAKALLAELEEVIDNHEEKPNGD